MIESKQLGEAWAMRDRCGVRLERALVTLGHVGEDSLWPALASVTDQEFVDLSAIEPDPEVARLVSFECAHKSGLLPLYEDGDRVVVAATQPRHAAELSDALGPLNRRPTRTVLVAPSAFDATLDRIHKVDLAQRAESDLLLRSPAESARQVPDRRQKLVMAALGALTALGLAAAPVAK